MSNQDYLAGVELLAMRKPDHPLLSIVRSGHTRLNELYLERALKDVIGTKAEETEIPGADPVLVNLLKEKRTLYANRAKLSNSFHDCTSDESRANVSSSIQRIQRAIEAKNAELNYYQQHGKLPEGNQVDIDVPDDPIALMNRLLSVRSSISYNQRRIRILATLAQDNPERKKIPTLETNLKELKRKKALYESRIAQENI
jgi:hypothetical protein